MALEEAELTIRRTTVKENKGGGSAGIGTESGQLPKRGKSGGPSLAEDTLGRTRANPRDSEQFLLACAVQFQRKEFRVPAGPERFGVCLSREITLGVEDDIAKSKAIAAKEEIRLIESVLSNERRRCLAVERSIGNGLDGGGEGFDRC